MAMQTEKFPDASLFPTFHNDQDKAELSDSEAIKLLRSFGFDSRFTCQKISADIETTGLDLGADIVCLTVCYGGKVAVLMEPTNRTALANFLFNDFFPENQFVFHYAKFDMSHLMYRGLMDTIGGVDCTRTLAKLANHQNQNWNYPTSLKPLLKHLGWFNPPADYNWNATATTFKMGETLTQRQVEYVAADVVYLEQLVDELQFGIDQKGLDAYAKMMEALPAQCWLEAFDYGATFATDR